MNTENAAAARLLTKPVPDNCSERYASGWVYADWHISKGGNLNSDAPGGWHEEKVNGFWDRLTAEREAIAEREKALDEKLKKAAEDGEKDPQQEQEETTDGT